MRCAISNVDIESISTDPGAGVEGIERAEKDLKKKDTLVEIWSRSR